MSPLLYHKSMELRIFCKSSRWIFSADPDSVFVIISVLALWLSEVCSDSCQFQRGDD